MTAAPTRLDRLMLHGLHLEWTLPVWFDDLPGDIKPTKSELDVWRWAFRTHGSRTLTSAQKDIVWTVFTYARPKEDVNKLGRRIVVGQAWPAQQTVADMTGYTTTTVGTALAAAEEAGWLVRQRVPNSVSRIYFSVPLVLPEPVDRRSRRSVPTENRTPVVTENRTCPDGEPDPRGDGDKPTRELTSPTVESTSPGETVEPSPTRVPDGVKVRFISGASEGTERTVTRDQASTAVRRGIAEVIEAVVA